MTGGHMTGGHAMILGMNGKIFVLGSTGYTGGLVVESLVRRGIRPTLVGRNRDRLRAVAMLYGGLPLAVADAADSERLKALLKQGDVLITTVGPFERHGWVTAEAAATVGAHYIDTTGEVGFVHKVHKRYSPMAKASGSVMLPAFGYDYVPGLLAGALAAERTPQATKLLIGYFATGSLRRGLSRGTRSTMADGLTSPSLIWRDATLQDVPTASSSHRFSVRGRKKTAVLQSGTEVLHLPMSYPQLNSIEVFNGWFPTIGSLIPLVARVAGQVSKRPIGRAALERLGTLLARGPMGPDAVERQRTQTHVVSEAYDAKGKKVGEVHLEGPSIYSLTGELVAMAAMDLAHGSRDSSGVVGPLDIYSLSELAESVGNVGLTEVNA